MRYPILRMSKIVINYRPYLPKKIQGLIWWKEFCSNSFGYGDNGDSSISRGIFSFKSTYIISLILSQRLQLGLNLKVSVYWFKK